MNLRELKLTHFRNYEQASFSFEENAVHILCGANAQGKTNLIEAIYFLSCLRSFRITGTDPMKMDGTDDFRIEAVLEKDGRREKLAVTCQGKRKLLTDFDKPVRTFSSFVGKCNAILFSPDDMQLFSAGPARRRGFLDMELVKLSEPYTHALNAYQKLLRMRNAALKEMNPDRNLIDVCAVQMTGLQKEIIEQRRQFTRRLSDTISRIYPFFSSAREEIEIQYKTFVDPDGDLEAQIRDVYAQSRDRELKTGTTAQGIHKDDLLFFLNGKPVLEISSQGQKRSILLALKLAAAEIIYETVHEYPILLLDDVFSELDPQRRQQLLKHLPETMQVFITTAEELPDLHLQRPVIRYQVENGTLKKEEGHV